MPKETLTTREKWDCAKGARERCTREWYEHAQKQGKDPSFSSVEKWVNERAEQQDKVQGKG